MKWARVIGGVAVDVVSGDPADFFVPELASAFVAVPQEVEQGWVLLQEIIGTALGSGTVWRPERSFIEEYLPGMYRYGQHAAPPVPQFALPAAQRRITKLAFRNRFTRAEKVAIEMAALDNPAASMSQRQAAAALRADMADQRDASYIDLDRADTRAGVMLLENPPFGLAPLLAPGRALEILDAPVQPQEVFR